MNEVLIKLITEYRTILSSSLSENEKLVSIKNMSSLLHNELLDIFKKNIGLDTYQSYEQFLEMFENLNNNVYKNQFYMERKDSEIILVFKNKRKPFLSAKELSRALINTEDELYIDLLAIFLSNDDDLLKLNLLF